MTQVDLSPNRQRIMADLDALAAIGKRGETGVWRLAYTPEDEEARRYLIAQMRAADMTVQIDAFGNILGRYAGTDPSLPPVMLGSHIDTPPLGGRFDGTVGVIGALEAVRSIRDKGLHPRRTIEVVSFQAEEPGRFGVGRLGSRAMAGEYGVDYLKSLKDKGGVTLYEAIRGIGLNPDDLASAVRKPGSAHAYLELHIEQGRVLEDAGLPVGVVTSIAASTRATVTVGGQADHSGATPMDLRRDALCGAAELVLALERFGRAEKHKGTVSTVGALTVDPGVINIVPGSVHFTVDVRSIDAESKEVVKDLFLAEVDRVSAERGLKISVLFSTNEKPVPCAPHLIQLVEGVCRDIGMPYMTMPSGAGHDAQHVAAFVPSMVVFIPCKGGISHAPEEYASPEEITRGVHVLAAAAYRLSTE